MPEKANWILQIRFYVEENFRFVAVSVISNVSVKSKCFVRCIIRFIIFLYTFRMILNKKSYNLKKGSGYHIDVFITCLLVVVCSLFGLPWMCAATVRSVVHVSALSVMSRTHAPGEKPKLLYIIEQRFTNIAVSALIGKLHKTFQ